MTLIAHVSDPHFGTERPIVVEALAGLLHSLSPQLIVLSGDITQRARARQFHSARRFIERFRSADVLAIPGNHDVPLFNLPARLFWPYRGYRKSFGDELEPVFRNSRILAISVKTTRRYRHVQGEVSSTQIARVSHLLRQATIGQLRMVITHQPVCVIKPTDHVNLLHGAQPAVRSWSEAGADLILGGHIHLPYVAPLHGTMPEVNRRVWAVQAGTAVSERTRGGIDNSVNIIRYQDSSGFCAVERWDYQSAEKAFRQVDIMDLPLQRYEPGEELCVPARRDHAA